LALRDLGCENVTVGSGESIGRGRFKAESLEINDNGQVINVDFINKRISNEVLLQKYIDSIKSFKKAVCEDG
jgi:hypothetical protein